MDLVLDLTGIGAGLAGLAAIVVAVLLLYRGPGRRRAPAATPDSERRPAVPVLPPSPTGPERAGPPRALPARFFSAIVIGGRLHILGLARRGPWDPDRMEWRSEPDVDRITNPRAGDRKITAREELPAVGSAGTDRPARFLWIREDLLADARRLWE